MQEILWEISFANLMMYLATIPRYDKDEDNEQSEAAQNPIDVSDLYNFMNNGNS